MANWIWPKNINIIKLDVKVFTLKYFFKVQSLLRLSLKIMKNLVFLLFFKSSAKVKSNLIADLFCLRYLWKTMTNFSLEFEPWSPSSTCSWRVSIPRDMRRFQTVLYMAMDRSMGIMTMEKDTIINMVNICYSTVTCKVLLNRPQCFWIGPNIN